MLEILDLSGNNILGKAPEQIGNISKLRVLILRSNKLESEIPIHIRYLQKLQIPDLAMNQLSGSIPPHLSNLSTLRNGYNFTSSQSNSAIRYANYYKEELYLTVKAQIQPYKKILSIFTFLDLSANNLSGDIPEDMGYLRCVISLNLSHNHIVEGWPWEIPYCVPSGKCQPNIT